MSNNFAFGGINTSLILGPYKHDPRQEALRFPDRIRDPCVIRA